MAAVHRWIFTALELSNSPSRKAGVDAEKELNYRQQCANLIQDMGQRLQVTQLCINTAIVYMHRFYMFHSFVRFHRNPIASACLFLAAKVEEQPRKLEHVIKSYHICVNRDQGPLDVKSETYLEFAQELVCNENVLLQTIGFNFTIEHPHKIVVKTCDLVKASKDLAQTSYFLATNSLHLTTMCLKYRHTVVACVCIHLACKWSNYQIPCSSEGKMWYEYVDKDVTMVLLEALTQEFLHILENCPSKLKKKIMTWKSGQRPQEDTAGMPSSVGGPPESKKPKLDSSVEPVNAAQPTHHPKMSHRPVEQPGVGLRRVHTEPVILHKDRPSAALGAPERKDRPKPGGPSHPPPSGHHREIPGYHTKPGQSSGPPGSQKPPGWTSSRPTHPPPPPKPRHQASAAQGSSAAYKQTSQQQQATDSRRSNIFDQMQSEQHHRTEPHRTSTSVNSSNAHLNPPQPAKPAPHQYSGGASSSSSNKSHHKSSLGQFLHKQQQQESAKLGGKSDPLSTKQKILQAHAAKVEKEKERLASLSSPPPGMGGVVIGKAEGGTTTTDEEEVEPGEIKDDPPQSSSSAITTQAKHEQDMEAKLHAEIKKQEASLKAKKLKIEREKKEKQMAASRQQQEVLHSNGSSSASLDASNSLHSSKVKSPKLRSPTAFNRQKSGSEELKTSQTKEQSKVHQYQEQQQKMQQEDRKRLRRMSEELGDPKIRQETIVMLDNVVVHPAELSPTPSNTTAQQKSGTSTPNKNKVSLESYRQRKPLSQAQGKAPVPHVGQQRHNDFLSTSDKPTQAVQFLNSITLQNVRPLDEILKPGDIDAETSPASEKPKAEKDLRGKSTSSLIKPESGAVKRTSSKPASDRSHSKGSVEQSGKRSSSSSLSRKGSTSSLSSSQQHTADQRKSLLDKSLHSATTKASSQSATAAKHTPSSQSATSAKHTQSSQSATAAKHTPISASLSQRPQQQVQSASSATTLPSFKSSSASSSSSSHKSRSSSSASLISSGQKPALTPPSESNHSSSPKDSKSASGGNKNSVKLLLKFGENENVSVSMSPSTVTGSDDHSQTKESSSHHHKSEKNRERKKEKHRHKHEKEHKSKHRDKSDRSAEGSASGDLKMKFSIKALKRPAEESSDSPFRIDNAHKAQPAAAKPMPHSESVPSKLSSSYGSAMSLAAAGLSVSLPNSSSDPALGSAIAQSNKDLGTNVAEPVKLVLHKDKSGQYGHKPKHSKRDKDRTSEGSRKRTYSPMENSGLVHQGATPPVVPAKVARNDSSLVTDVNGAKSPKSSLVHSHSASISKAKVSKLIDLQTRNIESRLEQDRRQKLKNNGQSSSQRNSPHM